MSRINLGLKLSLHDVLLIFVVTIWGANFGFVKTALNEVQPLAFNVLRLLIGVPAMLITLFVFEKRLWLPGRRVFLQRGDILPFAALSIFLMGDFTLYVKGLALTSSANASILYSMAPVTVAILSMFRGARFSRGCVLGLGLALGGVLLVITGQDAPLTALAGQQTRLGDLIVLGAVLSWAFFSHFSVHVLDRYSAVRVTTYAMMGAAVTSIAFFLPSFLGQSWAGLSPMGWAGVFYSSLLSNTMCLAIWYYAISKLGPVKVMTFEYLVPVIALFLASLLWKEAVLPAQVLGASLVLLGVRLVHSS
ncbi:MAG: DMT family transporter [Bacillota bacterium]